MGPVLKGYLQLTRPANLPTAAADILAGLAIAGLVSSLGQEPSASNLLLDCLFLICASVLLYAGGVVLNDYFDAEIDRLERPERPIPSGLIKPGSAAFFGFSLLFLGVVFAFLVGTLSGVIALVLACSIVLYDAVSNKNVFFGPLNMGICRGLNLILGISVMGSIAQWKLAIIPLIYIFAITLISRGEVHGNNRKHLIWAGILYAIVVFGVLINVPNQLTDAWQVLPFLGLFAFSVYLPLFRAYRNNSAELIRKAVISGVLGLVILDASWAAGFGVWWYGLLVLLLLPLSMALSKLFAVT
ncbi:UbiA-like protein EboC [Poritiphilus flavus]|uniref:UbiA-like protein EboC n=1 Tax=Poritiphilus flavus TaxID=2697053 RepID=A0A6L9EBS0_9FLAO|nr:UbiA-like protein EboC [Poritiphilus flavus]NAS12093.1 UbiA-like protein EboC [Poritiphilus flavus]